MSAELTILDWALVGTTIVLVLTGGYLGVSSQLGALAGFFAAPLAGYACWGVACTAATELGFAVGTAATAVAVIIDLVIALVMFGLVRLLVKKFVQECLGGCANAVAGALVGLFAALALMALLVGVGLTPSGEYSRGYCAERSTIVHDVAAWLDGHARRQTQ